MWEFYIVVPFIIIIVVCFIMLVLKNVSEDKEKRIKKENKKNFSKVLPVKTIQKEIIQENKILLSERDFDLLLEYIFGNIKNIPNEKLRKVVERYKKNTIKNKLKSV